MKNSLRRWIGIGLAVVMGMSVLTGCGGSSSGGGTSSGSGQNTPSGTPAAAGENGKGRYVEDTLELPFETGGENTYTNLLDLRALSDGTVRMITQTTVYGDDDIYHSSIVVNDSKDSGKTWEQAMDLSSFDFMKNDPEQNMTVDVRSAAINPDGELFLVVTQNSYQETEQDGIVKNSGFERSHYYLIKADGSFSEISIDTQDLPAERTWDYEYNESEIYAEEENVEETSEGQDDDIEVHESSESAENGENYSNINFVKFTDAENIFLITDMGTVYHVSASKGEITGSSTDLEYVNTSAAAGDQLILASWDKAVGYDLATGKMKAEYPELAQTINSSRGSVYMGDSTEDGKVYYASNEGVFLYDLGSNEKTMIVDGKLTSLVSVDTSIYKFLTLPNNEFAIFLEDYSEGHGGMKLLHYAYDPEMPSRPDKEITIYSLMDEYALSQFCALFQKSHPDIYVNIEYGMSGDDAVTSSDAIRTLNTRIMAGEGPDIIFLGGLPVDSYVEKGLLLDLSEVIDARKQEGSVFETIVDTYKTDNGTFAVPLTFSIPVVIGRKDLIEKTGTLAELAQEAENFAAGSDEGSSAKFMDLYTIISMIGTTMPTNAGSWFNDDGSLNADELKNYLGDLRRISDALKSGMTDEEKEQFSTFNDYLKDDEMQDLFTYSNFSGGDPAWNAVDIAAGNTECAIGNLGGTEGIQYLYSAAKKDPSISFDSMPGQLKNVFVPQNIVGINAKTADAESSKTFVEYLFSTDVQKFMASYSGFPVSKDAFDAAMTDPNKGNPGYKEGESYGSAGSVDENGKEMILDLYWPDAAFINDFKARLDTLTTAAYNDEVILTAIMKNCIGCVISDDDIDGAVDQVMKDINIYLSE